MGGIFGWSIYTVGRNGLILSYSFTHLSNLSLHLVCTVVYSLKRLHVNIKAIILIIIS